MNPTPSPENPNRPFTLIFSDLDGTLLDSRDYSWKAASPALGACNRLDIPIILVSSKTRAEMEVIRHDMGLGSPFISENGGGVYFPKEGGGSPPDGTHLAKNYWEWSLGRSYDDLIKNLKEIRKELGWNLTGFSDMTIEKISQLTGLDLDSSRLAAQREYNEPFIIENGENLELEALYNAVAQKGLQISVGGRFFHLHGHSDKGAAVGKVIAWYASSHPDVASIGIGDSPNDFPMMKQVHQAILIRSERQYPELEREIPSLIKSRYTGPEGWNDVVMKIISECPSGKGRFPQSPR